MECLSVCDCVCLRQKGEEVDRITRSLQICMVITRSLWKLDGHEGTAQGRCGES